MVVHIIVVCGVVLIVVVGLVAVSDDAVATHTVDRVAG